MYCLSQYVKIKRIDVHIYTAIKEEKRLHTQAQFCYHVIVIFNKDNILLLALSLSKGS